MHSDTYQIPAADMAVGIDIGSTTAKLVITEAGRILHQCYERHFSQVRQKTAEMLRQVQSLLLGRTFRAAISGSAGLGLAESAGIPFVQEVYATGEIVRQLEPETSAVIELGGEDAKIIFFQGGFDERMNGSCAGGTGAFIDQMATLLDVPVEDMDRLSQGHTRIYPIASRCGVFAKTDIQPLLNQGARKEDIVASIYQAVVNQTIAGLAQGRRIQGKVMFLGGPLYYSQGLRDRFAETLKLKPEEIISPPYALYAVAMGAAMYAARLQETFTYDSLLSAIENAGADRDQRDRLPPLFRDQAEYDAFAARHARATVPERDIASYEGDAWLGIDCGSTTTKLVLISRDRELLYTYYDSNRGNPVSIVREQLMTLYRLCGERIRICGAAVTGYGEELIKNAFHLDLGVVETVAHYTAARHFMPEVEFILDIGGQDIKCFRVKNGAIDTIMLNEACSSGCGSFIETFARSMGQSIEEFSKAGLFSRAPVNLGSRCTVFMNSSVKQSQKDGATVEDISAGLSVSVIKNAIYKVIRAGTADELGSHIVVQGGTFLNDAVLRAFEQELDRNVVRPSIAGLMGAYGAALRVMDRRESGLVSPAELEHFTHESRSAVCHGCTNQCHLTVNTFSGGRRFISGNQCQRALGLENSQESLPNLYEFKRQYLAALDSGSGRRGSIGLPLALGMYELLPLWHGIFRALDFTVLCSGPSSRRIYEKGQFSIPSDTACYPAKIMHGHIETLWEMGADRIFYPCLSYNVDEKKSDNHYNCPVVAYYSELLRGNIQSLNDGNFLYPYLNINDPKELARELYRYLKPFVPDLRKHEVRAAVRAGMEAYETYRNALRQEGRRALDVARSHGDRILILAGRPYHIDPEIGHGIDRLANSLGFAVVSEDSVFELAELPSVHVLNQWTYHARLYRAAHYAARHEDTELVQLVSFGCGVDAITTDEVRRILEKQGKLYTQIKIDEITNLGAVRIRLRSLLGALEERACGS